MEDKTIIFFDGVCVLCNGFADWIIKHDHQNKFYLSSLQGKTALRNLQSQQEDAQDWSIVIRLVDGSILKKSDAVLKIFSDIGGGWKIFKIFYIFPRSWRNGMYDFIAKRRYKLFGKRSACRMPKENEKLKFLP